MKMPWQRVALGSPCNPCVLLWWHRDKNAVIFICGYANVNININSLLPPSRSSSKYDLRGKCRRTCIRQGTRYGRAIAPTLMELLHDHPTIYNTSSTSALLPAHSTLYNTNTSTSLHAHPTIHNTSTSALLHAHPRRRNRATSRSPNSPRHKNTPN